MSFLALQYVDMIPKKYNGMVEDMLIKADTRGVRSTYIELFELQNVLKRKADVRAMFIRHPLSHTHLGYIAPTGPVWRRAAAVCLCYRMCDCRRHLPL